MQSTFFQIQRPTFTVGNRTSFASLRKPCSHGRLSFTPMLHTEKKHRRRITYAAANEENQSSSATKEEDDDEDMSRTLFLMCSVLMCCFLAFLATNISEKEWEEEVLKSSVPVLVDFWAKWCGPCKMLGPRLDELINEYGKELKAVKLNTDKNPSIATELGIRSIPTIMVFKGGKKVEAIIGAVSTSDLRRLIKKHLE